MKAMYVLVALAFATSSAFAADKEKKAPSPAQQAQQEKMKSCNAEAKSKDLKHMSDAKITIAQAVEAALKSTSGTAIAAELDSNWGKASYDVKVLQADGTVMKVKIDAVDSSVIRTKKDK